MSNYTKGRNFEYEVKEILENAGYQVIRSAGSHSISDLVAFKGDKIYLIQCKYGNNAYYSKKELHSILKNISLPFLVVSKIRWGSIRIMHFVNMSADDEIISLFMNLRKRG